MTTLARFLAQVYTQPLLRADAIVVCCGEDAAPRADIAFQLWRQGAAPLLVVSGGKHEPPRWVGAEAVRDDLIGRGVDPERIVVEGTSQHTRAQAVAVVDMARARGWRRLLLVASHYHIPRAFLTFVRALEEARVDSDDFYDDGEWAQSSEPMSERLHLIAVPTSQSPWHEPPAGMVTPRADLFDGELVKLDVYGDDVASPYKGLAYLHRWEGR